MRERLGQLGGILEIRSDSTGTTVTATLPLQDSAISGGQKSRMA
jgi:signal transduction histidine kinase